MIAFSATRLTPRIVRAAVAVMLCLAGTTIALCGPIHDATRKGDEAKVIALLKANPDLVSSRDKFGNTPLHVAAIHDQPAIAELLLANGADVNARNNPGGKEVLAARYNNKTAKNEHFNILPEIIFLLYNV